ncbi:hypothetical protein LSUE1_G006516 [Lachnellula suecica]|uniref:BTB domain-containing protein n=1 Tax=Lachnellula suecica TaxID=602035 RepID=A0A8T9C8I3_9HELO|nr:hypothetical protein LSUE1_G006516 [Lachnellula suecica]
MSSVTFKREASEDSPDANASKRVARSQPKKDKGPRPSFLSGTYQSMVTVNVNDTNSNQSFLIYKEIICYYSPFFEAAFNGGFEEGKNQTMDLCEASPKVFGMFVNWLYTQSIAQTKDESDFHSLVELWILADRLLIPTLQNDTLEAIDRRRVALNARPVPMFNKVYEYTSPSSPLRKYIIQLAGSGFDLGMVLLTPEKYPKELLVDMINFMRTGDQRKWVKFSKEELKQFFVDEGDKQ